MISLECMRYYLNHQCGHIKAWLWLHLSSNWPFWRLFFVLVSVGKPKPFSVVGDLNFLQSPLILSPPPHLKAFKVVYLNHIFSLFFSGSLSMQCWLLCSVYCVLKCVSQWLRVLHTPIYIPMCVQQSDAVYVLNMCKEYFSTTEFQLYPIRCQSSQVLACPPQLVCPH